MENKSDKGTIAGALSIVSGALGVLYGASIAAFMIVFNNFFSNPSFTYAIPMLPGEFYKILIAVYSLIFIIIILIGILGIAGGIFALKRTHWGVALAGAIAGSITFFPCGIAAIVFVSLAQPEFSRPKIEDNSEFKPPTNTDGIQRRVIGPPETKP